MIRAVVGTATVWVPPPVTFTVTVVPLTLATWPRTNVKLAGGLGRGPFGLPLAPGLGERLGFGLAPRAAGVQVPFISCFGVSVTVVAVTAPVASFWPVAVIQVPEPM